jgi:hypothetical protein
MNGEQLRVLKLNKFVEATGKTKHHFKVGSHQSLPFKNL